MCHSADETSLSLRKVDATVDELDELMEEYRTLTSDLNRERMRRLYPRLEERLAADDRQMDSKSSR